MLNILIILQNQEQDLLRLLYNGSNSFLFLNAVKTYINLKQNNQNLGNISKDFTLNNMKTGLKGIVKVFSVDFNPINASDFRYP